MLGRIVVGYGHSDNGDGCFYLMHPCGIVVVHFGLYAVQLGGKLGGAVAPMYKLLRIILLAKRMQRLRHSRLGA